MNSCLQTLKFNIHSGVTKGVQRIMYSVQGTVFSVQYTLNSVERTVHSITVSCTLSMYNV